MRMALILLGFAASAAWSQTQKIEWDARQSMRFLIGLRAENGPVYFGQTERGSSLRPVLALRWGRVHFSNSGGSRLMGERSSRGATADWLANEQLDLSAGLRIDGGRDFKDDERLSELAEVRRTLRLRLGLTWHQSPERDFSASWSSDLLGHGGGQLLQLGWSQRLLSWDAASPVGGHWQVQAGLAAGSRTYMRSYFGVGSGTRFAPYEPGAGLRDAWIGLGWRRELDRHWIVFGGASASHLLGPARDAPFVQRSRGWSADFGVAWRS